MADLTGIARGFPTGMRITPSAAFSCPSPPIKAQLIWLSMLSARNVFIVSGVRGKYSALESRRSSGLAALSYCESPTTPGRAWLQRTYACLPYRLPPAISAYLKCVP